jgi:Inner membrane protein YgaP-like, transmembrane domain
LKKNVGKIDRTLRFILALALVWLGVIVLNGKEGNAIGIIVAITSLLPFYMSLSGSCFMFKWCKIHSLSKKECEVQDQPIAKETE